MGRRPFFRVVVSGLTFHSTQVSPAYPVVAAMGEPGPAPVLGARRGRFVVFGWWVAPRALARGIVVDRHRESRTVWRHRVCGFVSRSLQPGAPACHAGNKRRVRVEAGA